MASLPTQTQQPLKPYNKYKPSGIAWLGDIPEHWERWKISRGVKKIGSGTTPSSGNRDFYENGTINWLNTGDFNDGILFKCKKKVTSKAIQENSALKIFPSGTLSIAMYGATIGKVCIIQFDATTNQACCNIEEGNVFSNKFLMYWFIGHKLHIVNLSYGGGQPNISQDVIKSLYVPCSIKSEQEKIAQFLDYKTAKIDRFIHKKKQLIKLLNEQKAAIINDAVTKGLNQNAKTKPSGIEWLGDIPKHWEVRKLKYVAESVLGKMLCNEDKGGYSKKPYLKSKNIQWLNVDISDVEEMWFSDKELIQYRLKKGDLVLSEGGEVGKTCLWNEELEECYIQNSAHKVTVNNDNLAEFYLYLFFLYGNKGAFDAITNKVSIGHLTKDKLINLKCLCPPLSEQQQIVSHIKQETAKLNQAIATIEKEIALVQEYRTALIAEAVTGKIDVRSYELGIDSDALAELTELEEEQEIEPENENL
jgi:type I restriction enzyme S subunit